MNQSVTDLVYQLQTRVERLEAHLELNTHTYTFPNVPLNNRVMNWVKERFGIRGYIMGCET